jgi:hypothetical protein
MKAKELAAKIIATVEASPEVAVNVLVEVVNEAMGIADTRKQEASKYAALREGFQKWRSIVGQVKTALPLNGISEGMFLQALYLNNQVLFAQCVREKVFLGYELSASEQEALQQSKKALASAEAAERDRQLAAEDAHFERSFNLPKGYVQARRDNDKAVRECLELYAAALMFRHRLKDEATAA